MPHTYLWKGPINVPVLDTWFESHTEIADNTTNNTNNTMQYLQWNCIIPDHFCHHLFVYILLLGSPEWQGERKKSTGRFLYKHELKTNLCFLHYAHLQTPNKFQSDHSLKPLLAQESFPLQQGTSSTVILNYCPNKHKKNVLITVSPMYIHTACSFHLFRICKKAYFILSLTQTTSQWQEANK